MSNFDPDWVISPGETLREWMAENGFTPSAAAVECGRLPRPLFRGIMEGTVEINDFIAQRLQAGTGIPARLWLNLERAYRQGLAAGKRDTSHD